MRQVTHRLPVRLSLLFLILVMILTTSLFVTSCGGTAATTTVAATTVGATTAAANSKTFTVAELATFDGQSGRKAYIAVDGIV